MGLMTFLRSAWMVLRGRASLRVIDPHGKTRAVIDLSDYRLDTRPKDLNGRVRRHRRLR